MEKWAKCGTSLVIQWLRLCPSDAGGVGLVLGRGTKIPHAMQHGQKQKNKRKQKKNPKLLWCMNGPERNLKILQERKFWARERGKDLAEGQGSRRAASFCSGFWPYGFCSGCCWCFAPISFTGLGSPRSSCCEGGLQMAQSCPISGALLLVSGSYFTWQVVCPHTPSPCVTHSRWPASTEVLKTITLPQVKPALVSFTLESALWDWLRPHPCLVPYPDSLISFWEHFLNTSHGPESLPQALGTVTWDTFQTCPPCFFLNGLPMGCSFCLRCSSSPRSSS